jgi:hypothetical protein
VLRLEGHANGLRVVRNCKTADAVTGAVAALLDACGVDPLRQALILPRLWSAAEVGRVWRWSAEEFVLSVHSAEGSGE